VSNFAEWIRDPIYPKTGRACCSALRGRDPVLLVDARRRPARHRGPLLARRARRGASCSAAACRPASRSPSFAARRRSRVSRSRPRRSRSS
jgi:hypothetical protein